MTRFSRLAADVQSYGACGLAGLLALGFVLSFMTQGAGTL
jgi:hypothetical protein